MDCITTENLTLSYDNTPVIRDLCLSIPRGKITVIIGPNGCGKSTLLKSIARILKPDQGRILIDGTSIKEVSSKALARKMSFLPQSPKAPSGLKVEELISYGRFPHKKGFGTLIPEDYTIIEDSLKIAGITDFRDRSLEDLSGGQRQRAWIAMSLCQRTELMLLDEPTTYLDLAHQLDILTLLSDLNKQQGRTIIMVLHELNNASRFADHMIGMRAGQIIEAGPPEKVMTKQVLKDLFQINAEIIKDPQTGRPMYLSYTKS